MTTEERLRNSSAMPIAVAGRAGELAGDGLVGSTRPLGRSSVSSTRPPLSHERLAEQVLIGCVLVDDFEVWGELEECPMDADDFLFPEHKALWRAFRWIEATGGSVDASSTVLALDQMGTIDAVDQWLDKSGFAGVEEYLVELLATSFSAKGCGAFLRAVKHYSEMRSPVAPRHAREIGL